MRFAPPLPHSFISNDDVKKMVIKKKKHESLVRYSEGPSRSTLRFGFLLI